ncbi:energy transducer TonB [Psychrobacter alimentarius]|uniref:energy transducer TonB n=1 Tax=Psychrobacter alimentarius TaxID=261164 RepID=UPI003FD23BC9
MIPAFFTRPATTWVTILVIALHGVIAWAMVSVDSPPPIVIKNSPKVIHLELITLASAADKTLSLTKPSPTKPAPTTQPTAKHPAKPNTQPMVAIENTETAKPTPAPKTEPPEPLQTHTNQQTTQIKNQTLGKAILKQDTDVENEPKNLPSEQKLTIVESRKIVSRSDEEETEDDLSAMIRAVTAQFNREQAIQQRAAKNQANRQLMEQEQWRIQAANEAVIKMLALAAAQAEDQNNDETDSEDSVDKQDEETTFLANDGSWMEKQEPITSVPALVWRNINTSLGDVFIVLLKLHVDKEGHITKVQVLESSTSPIIDAIATTQVRAGQLNPLIHNGRAVDGIVPMSLVYERP